MTTQTEETVGVLAGLVIGFVLAVLLLSTILGGFILALVILALLPVALGILALEGVLGYRPAARPVPEVAAAPAAVPVSLSFWRSAGYGLMGAAGLFALYLITMTITHNLAHTLTDLSQDRVGVACVLLGFGILVGLASYLHTTHVLDGRWLALGLIGTGVGMVSLLACCTPMLVKFPLFSAFLPASLFLLQYKVSFILLAIAVNLGGILGMATPRLMPRAH